FVLSGDRLDPAERLFDALSDPLADDNWDSSERGEQSGIVLPKRNKQVCELTSSIVREGQSSHRQVGTYRLASFRLLNFLLHQFPYQVRPCGHLRVPTFCG
ncbi:hypothetical protein, partial [Mesorhizobium sp.]|uniref:hypothetical protein n=1 Tax=Mesorhizobium sp. TaxID=1871066 RepID=UPI0025EA3BEE